MSLYIARLRVHLWMAAGSHFYRLAENSVAFATRAVLGAHESRVGRTHNSAKGTTRGQMWVALHKNLPVRYVNPPAMFEPDLPKCSYALKS
jgi:hypothetical protein